MREVVDIVRMVNRDAHPATHHRYDGKYYKLDFSEMQPAAPPLRTDIPIWIAALRGPLVSLAAEIADGVLGHYIWSIEWLRDKIPDYLKRGLDRGGKQRSDVHFNAWLAVAINNNRAEAINDARPTVAFYAGIEQYEPFFAAHGFGDVAKRLQEGVKKGDYQGVAKLVPDEMAQAFVVCGSADECKANRTGLGRRRLNDARTARLRSRARENPVLCRRHRRNVLLAASGPNENGELDESRSPSFGLVRWASSLQPPPLRGLAAPYRNLPPGWTDPAGSVASLSQKTGTAGRLCSVALPAFPSGAG